MTKILFVCLGNICRSPMAEFVMKDLVKKAGLASQFRIESAAPSREEIGNPVYPPARRKLSEHGIACGGHAARQLTKQDYDEYDLLIGMDSANLRNMHRICGDDPDGKLRLLMDYTDRPGDVADDPRRERGHRRRDARRPSGRDSAKRGSVKAGGGDRFDHDRLSSRRCDITGGIADRRIGRDQRIA